ncbi:MAG: O-antigen ligase family protein [Myxococcota bacterium]
MRFAFFVVFVVVLARLILQDPVWASFGGAYTYFAVPSQEFHVPGLPYQAGFFLVAIILSLRTPALANARALAKVETIGIEVVRTALQEVKQPVLDGVVDGLLSGTLSVEGIEPYFQAIRETAHKIIHDRVPGQVVAAAKSVLDLTLDVAIEGAIREGQDVISGAPDMPAGALRRSIFARITQPFEKRLTGYEEALRREIHRLTLDHERLLARRSAENTGVLGVPLPRSTAAGFLGNAGIWLHLAFTVATYIAAHQAKWSVEAASKHIDVCVLLFLPMLGLIAGTRAHWQFRIMTWGWLLGVLHLSYNGITIWLRYGGRADNVGGQSSDANWLGIICVCVAPVALSMFLSERTKLMRWIGLGATAIYAGGIVASGSRGAMIALVGGLAYWLLWTNKKGKALGIAGAGLAAFLVVAPSSFWERMGTIFLSSENNPWIIQKHEASAESRKEAWALALEVFKEHPTTGIGPSNFIYESQERLVYIDPNMGRIGIMTHNTWLQLLAEYGIFGAVIWYAAYLWAVIAMFLAWRKVAHLKNDPEWGWLPGYFIGFHAAWISNAIAITFVSCQWLDYNYWIIAVGPLALQIAKDVVKEVEWFSAREPWSVPRPPPRYGPPSKKGLALDDIDLHKTPVLR